MSVTPLLPLVNSRILITEPGPGAIISGKIKTSTERKYLLKAYLKRAEGEGTDDGELPSWGSRASSGGGITSKWLLRGYVTEYTEVPSNYSLGSSYLVDDSGLVYEPIVLGTRPPLVQLVVYSGMKAEIRHGTRSELQSGQVVVFGGKYSGLGPDETIYKELLAVPITVGSVIVR